MEQGIHAVNWTLVRRKALRYVNFQHTTLPALLATQADQFPDRPYLSHDEERLTYADLARQAWQLGSGLQRLGLRPGDRLAVILPNVPAYVLTLFASAHAGLILVPINRRRGPAEVADRLARTQARALVTRADGPLADGRDHLALGRELCRRLPYLEYLISPGQEGPDLVPWSDLLAPGDPTPELKLRPEDPAAIVHTLGRTGRAQGAVLTHGALIRNAACLAAHLACEPDDVFLGAVPFSNAFGLTATILACTVAGARLACLPRYHPGQALALIAAEGVTVHHGVPTMFALELNHPDFDAAACASLRTGIMSGAPCPPMLVQRVREEMNCRLILAYGLTEASPGVTCTELDDGPITAVETVGRPLEGVSIKVIGPTGETLPDGETGELCVQGYNVMAGYWDDAAATARVLDAEGWLRTGDLALIDPDGPVRIVGRLDDVINRAGFKLYPEMIEMVLRAHPDVRDVAVVGVPDLIFGQVAVACVVPRPAASPSAEQLLAFAGDHLPDYAWPDRLLFFDALPRRRGGRVDKQYLRDRVRIRGRAWLFGRNVDTDAIIPARHCNTADPAELARHCMEDADPGFIEQMRRGDLIVAGANFGCGSSREVAPLAIKAAGVSAVVAHSFARIFFRNAINIGLPILECPAAVAGIALGDEIEVVPASGTIHNLTQGTAFQAAPFPPFLQHIIDLGGLLPYVEARLAGEMAGEPGAAPGPAAAPDPAHDRPGRPAVEG